MASLELVCKECTDPKTPASSVDIVIGRKFLVQASVRAETAELAYAKMLESRADATGTEVTAQDALFVLETKFDGWRLAVHCGGTQEERSILYAPTCALDPDLACFVVLFVHRT